MYEDNWRPDNWDELVHAQAPEIVAPSYFDGIEDGADLILEVLKKQGRKLTIGGKPAVVIPDLTGYLVLIPEMKTCVRCGEEYCNPATAPICPACQREDEKNYERGG